MNDGLKHVLTPSPSDPIDRDDLTDHSGPGDLTDHTDPSGPSDPSDLTDHTDHTDLTLWEQYPGESDRWFSIFTTYRLLGPRRTVNEVANIVREREGNPLSNRAPGSFCAEARRTDWPARATAWDRSLETQDELDYLVQRESIKNRRVQALLTHLDLLTRAAGQLNPEDASIRDVSHGLSTICTQLRTELDPGNQLGLDRLLSALPEDVRVEVIAQLKIRIEPGDS